MRLLSIQSCKPGMKLGKKIFNEDGMVLLSENVELTAGLIQRLSKIGIEYVYVEDPRTEDIIIRDPISDRTRVESITAIRSSFQRLVEESGRKRSVSTPYIGKEFKKVLTMILDDISANKDALIMVMNMNAVDNYLFQHSMNVCVYAAMLGNAFGYSEDELTALGMGALLHDVGKTQVPHDVLFKPGKLDDQEFNMIKKHTEIGFKMLKDEPNIPLLSAHCAFQHHERWNGSGYPRGIAKDEIHEYARWIGLVDSYDAMTTHRVYRRSMLPHEAMEILYTGAGTLFEKSKIELFRDKVAIYPPGIAVGLHTGESGVVVDINTSCPHRPIVRVLEDPDGQELKEPYEIDLSKNLTYVIVSVNDIKTEQLT
jgi:putative nucleotidyltransferase with HDIG domain